MRLAIVTSEAVPYIKTGGLGDVAGNLATQFASSGHEVILFLPDYKVAQIDRSQCEKLIPNLSVKMGDTSILCDIYRYIPQKNLTVLLIHQPGFFHRNPIYDDGLNAYHDNGARFAFFSKAVLDIMVTISFSPDIILCNDWQAALVPYYVKCWGWGTSIFKNSATILAIHNMSYQGQTDLSFSKFIGLNWMQVREDEFESLNSLNLLKGGIFYADQIITVSPSYAKEILAEPGGFGLSKYLNRRKDDVIGILNGIDTDEWNPEVDPLLPATFNSKDLSGKAVCKKHLQNQFLLDIDENIPVFGFVGRFAYQKGLDILMKCIHEVMEWKLQFVILGTGNHLFSHFYGEMPKFYPGRAGSYIGFNSKLAHLIEAGSDFFLMPSYFEPCGLNQMYSMAYGTLPIVHGTGGLLDTVTNMDVKKNKGTGFVFNDMTPDALKNTIGWALDTWYNHKNVIKKARTRAMSQDFSWKNSIKAYDKVFNAAVARKRHWV